MHGGHLKYNRHLKFCKISLVFVKTKNGGYHIKGTHTVCFSSSFFVINQKHVIPRTDFIV